MVRNKGRIIRISIIVILVIAISIAYKLWSSGSGAKLSNLPDYAKNRKIVTLWLRNNYYENQIKEQVENYNISNKDNIYVVLESYGGDYINMLRMKLLTSYSPDIFEIGTYDIMRNDKLVPLDTMGINLSKIPKNRLLVYKGKPVGINISGTDVKFIWNKEIFKQCGLDPEKGPKTWSDVKKYSEIIKSKMPNVVPFEAPMAGVEEFKGSIGEPSVNSDTITPSFWNYKEGTYDYSSSKYILNFYRDMYAKNLMSKDLEESDNNKVMQDFYYKQTAMLVSFYDDKINFLSQYPLNFDIGISDLPKINANDKQQYYFIDDISTIAVNSNAVGREEVKKVFDWFVQTTMDTSKVQTNKYKSNYFPKYAEYDNVSDFKFPDKDPTPALGFGYKRIKDLIYSSIRGEKSTDDAIKELNKYLNDYCSNVKLKDKGFFNSFIGEE